MILTTVGAMPLLPQFHPKTDNRKKGGALHPRGKPRGFMRGIKKSLNGAEAKPLIGAAVHTAMVLMYPNEDEYGAREILRNTHALRHLQLPVMDLEKYGDWTNKCDLLKAHIEKCQQNMLQEKERNADGR